MKRMKGICVLATVLFFGTAGFAMAGSASHGDHSGHQQGTDAGGDMSTHSGHGGNHIHESHVSGHHFSYELIDMREKMKEIPEMKDTHHLMIYVKDSEGNPLTGAKVGYMITGPDGKEQKKMAMGMGGGYGADIQLSAPGKHTIKAKVMAGEHKLMDTFEYELKQ